MKTADRPFAFNAGETVKIGISAIAYFLAHQISFLFPDSVNVLMVVWPVAGIGLAILIINPRRLWPALVAAFFAAGNAANVLSGRPILGSFGYMTANILESVASAWLMTHWCGKNITFTRVKDALALICSASMINAGTATIGAFTAAQSHIASFGTFWETWWIADGLGMLLVAPIIIIGGTLRISSFHVRWDRMAEFGAFFGIWLLSVWLSVYPDDEFYILSPQPYIFFGLIAWCALRFGPLGVATVMAALAAFVIPSKAFFIGDAVNRLDPLLLKQIYLGCLGITGYLLAASSSEQKLLARELGESEERYRCLFEKSRDALMTLELPSWAFTSGNLAAIELFGAKSEEEFVAYRPGDLSSELQPDGGASDEKSREMIGIAMSQGSHLFEWRHKRINGEEFPASVLLTRIELKGKEVLQATVRDVSDRKKAEDERLRLELQVQQTQKLESLGILAGGIAHDFNNLMGGIYGYIDMAGGRTRDKKAAMHLSKAMNTIERARALTQQLLTFAKGGDPIQKIGLLFPFVQETAQFALSGANVSCRCDVPRDLWACNFDRNQIGQVIDNLVINAQQAMPSGGAIELTARNIALSEKEVSALPRGNYVKISVADRGIGMSRELIPCIFDPFFTTKAKGHGLGLATSYSIVARHGGVIDVESEPGKGSTFHVYLPAAAEEVLSDPEPSAVQHRGSGTFLIMDDEDVMRETIQSMLVSLGYKVICKENGKEAVDYYSAALCARRKIAGMIFDLTVPDGMGGKDAVSEIRKMDAGTELPVFVASGYADDPVMKKPADYGFTSSICKPFRKSELSEMLNRYVSLRK